MQEWMNSISIAWKKISNVLIYLFTKFLFFNNVSMFLTSEKYIIFWA